MSRIVREQLFSSWESMQETYQKLSSMVRSGEYGKLPDLLMDCQDEAVSIGEQIEAVYGEGYKTVRYLEDYCETIYHISENSDKQESCEKYCMSAEKQLAEIRKTMEMEIKDRIEIAFFPYKASMWSCLESIYLAAAAEGSCEVYCVPIPYYELRHDGTLGEFHDESGEYPDYIRITSWQEYGFEIRKPDIIFIHNPWDDWGTEDRVEPRFYAGNLRQYTGKLVYVPDLLLSDIRPDDQEAIIRMKRSCLLPGVFHADKVIAESESMRAMYIGEYERMVIAQEVTPDDTALEEKLAVWEDKILALGSPKADGKTDPDHWGIGMPQEWERIIRKPDGKRKKVILYNTCMNMLLTNGDRLLDKIEHVLSAFKERREDVAFWWRPQPLIKRMWKNIRSDLQEKYKDIEERYKEEGWGIYDDTDDEYRALTVSDACFGDWSPLVWEYQNCGKPVMVQNVNILDHIECSRQPGYGTLSFLDMFRENNEFWVSDTAFNGIFKINAWNHESEFIGRFKKEKGQRGLHRQIMAYGEWLIFIPEMAENIAFFNKNTYEIEYVKAITSGKREEARVAGTHIYKDELWVFSCYLSQDIIIIDLENRKIRYSNIMVKALRYENVSVSEPYFGAAAVKQDEIWMPVKDTNEVIRYSFVKAEVQKFELRDPKCRINSMDAAGDKLWLTFFDTDQIMEWNPAAGEETIHRTGIECHRNECPFSGIVPISESQCILLPSGTDGLMIKKGNELKRVEYPAGFYQIRNWKKDWIRNYTYRREEDRIFIFPVLGNMVLIYDIGKEALEGEVCAVPKEWDRETVDRDYVLPYFMTGYMVKHRAAYEEQEDDLENFIYFVKNHCEGQGKEDNAGERVLTALLGKQPLENE